MAVWKSLGIQKQKNIRTCEEDKFSFYQPTSVHNHLESVVNIPRKKQKKRNKTKEKMKRKDEKRKKRKERQRKRKKKGKDKTRKPSENTNVQMFSIFKLKNLKF